MPEVMFGFSKNFMLHAATSFSNMRMPGVRWEGAYAYAKYRFLSNDDVHKHFRMAVFANANYSRNSIDFDEINIQGDVSGLQGGLIATKLQNKLALSSSVSFIKALNNSTAHQQHTEPAGKALGYSLSAGYLILPKEYTSYNQLNFNVYTELLAQQSLNNNAYFIDAAPAIQFIFNSNSKLNIGYRFQLTGNAHRNMNQSFLVAFEHTFFNALK